MEWKRKPTVLIVGDSACLDTGFGRVAREIGVALVNAGCFRVAQLGLFHKQTDRIVPFHIYPVMSREPSEQWGQKAYDEVLRSLRPDLVITVNEIYQMQHIIDRPRVSHKLISYIPIDGLPVVKRWTSIMSRADHVVLYGQFGRRGVIQTDKTLLDRLSVIPLGVDTDAFRPQDSGRKVACKSMIAGDTGGFVVGCVARNSTRKQIPRLLKAFSRFVLPWASCKSCGAVAHGPADILDSVGVCPECGSSERVRGSGKDDAVLYLHCNPLDRAGHNLHEVCDAMGISDRVIFPDLTSDGVGCSDGVLADIYNGIDIFVLPTGGEGWGLPILEAMSSGVPVLVPEYSGHVDFTMGAAEYISVHEYQTQVHNSAEHAVPDIQDMVMKMDRFYLTKPEWLDKWGKLLAAAGVDMVKVENEFDFGADYRATLSKLGREKALNFTWSRTRAEWLSLVNDILQFDQTGGSSNAPVVVSEV